MKKQNDNETKVINKDLEISGSIEDFYQFKNPL